MASKYLKHTTTLLSGIGISQLLSILSLPLLTRLYTSEQIGSYFFVFAIAGIGSAIFSLQSHLTIVGAQSKVKAHKNLSYSLTINLITNLILFAFCGLVYISPLMTTFIGRVGSLIFYFPLLSFLLSAQLSFDNYYNHQQQYKKLRAIKITRSVIMIGLQLLIPLVWMGNVHILIWAQVTGLLVITISNWAELKPLIILGNKSGWVEFIEQQKEILYYSTGLSIVNSISTNIPYIMITYFFGTSTTGYYGMAQRIVGMPLGLLGESIGVVFFQKGSQLKTHHRKLKPLFIKTLSMLLKFGIGPAIISFLFAKPLLTYILGNEWEMTGTILQIITPWLFLVYINTAISYLISILQIQRYWLKYEVAHFIMRTAAIWGGFIYWQSATISIGLLTLVGILFNIYFLSIFNTKIKNYEQQLVQNNPRFV
jgi:lipopolysaccharide exporter